MKAKAYITLMIFVGGLVALVMSSVAWFSANSHVSTGNTIITSSDAMVLDLSIPTEEANDDAYLGQTGIEYDGLDSPYCLTYTPISVGVNISGDDGYYLFCDISAVSITPVVQTEDTEVLTPQEIQQNYTWRFGLNTRIMVLNPDTGIYEAQYVEKIYKNVNGFLYDEDTGEPLRAYSHIVYHFKLYLYFLGEEGYSLLTNTQANISEAYTFAYSNISYMWATFNIAVTIGVRDLYLISFDSQGGSECESIPTTGASGILLPTPEPPDGTVYFGGWYDNLSYEGEPFENDTLIDSPRKNDFVLYAKWIDIE